MISLLIIHAAITWTLVGLIWTIQLVHYPLLKNVGPVDFIAYHERHMWLISWLVGPLFLAEASSAGLLIYLGERSWLFGISLAALVMVWGSTALFQVPLHQKLEAGHDFTTIDRLVHSNWLRTFAWTVRGLCLLGLLITRYH